MPDETQNLEEDDAVQTTKFYLIVGVVCAVGTLMVIANGSQGTSQQVGTTPPATPAIPSPFKLPIPSATGPAQGLGRVVESVADGTEAASGVVQEGSGMVKDGMGWVRKTLSDKSPEETSKFNLNK